MKSKREPPEQEEADEKWIDERLKTMTLQEKAGQLIFLKVPADPAERTTALHYLPIAMGRLHIGGLKIQVGDLDEHVQIANTLQELSTTPMLLCADFERGVGERFENTVRFPPPMALGAIADLNLTRQVGRGIAAESRAAGISLIFAPVVDVNSNPANPAINVRSLSVPYVDAYLCACDESATTQELVFDALVGRAPISGKLPVTIPG